MTIKILRRVAGIMQQYTPLQVSAGAASAGELIAANSAGKIDSTFLPDGLGDNTRTGSATEALTAGKFVNEYSNGGVWSVRLADNSNGRPATGFVMAAFASDATATVFPLDAVNGQLTGLTVGSNYFLGTAGAVIGTPLDGTVSGTAGYIDQQLGVARSATELLTDDYGYVVL